MRDVEKSARRGIERLPNRFEVGAELRLLLGGDRRIVERGAPVGGPLVHGQRSDFARDARDDLHTTRAGADDRNALAREVDRCRRPARSVVRLAAKLVGEERHRKNTGRGDEESRANLGAVTECHRPCSRRVVVDGGGDLDAELHVAAKIEPIDHMVEVALGFGLFGEVLLPFPLVEELLREQVAVGVTLGVETRSGVTVPVPGTPDAAAGLDQLRREARLPRAVQLVDAGDAGTDDEHIDIDRGVGGLHQIIVPTGRL